MAQQLLNRFSSFELSSEEIILGYTFNTNQKQVIQNLISDAAHQKVALVYDPQNPISFAQREAELHGQIEVLEFLLLQQEVLQHNSQQPTNFDGE